MNDAPDDEEATEPPATPDDPSDGLLPPPDADASTEPDTSASPAAESLPPPAPAAPSPPSDDPISPRTLIAAVVAGALVVAALVWALTRGGGDGIDEATPSSSSDPSLIFDTTTSDEIVPTLGVTTLPPTVVPSSAAPPTVPSTVPPTAAPTIPGLPTFPTTIPPTIAPPTAVTTAPAVPPASVAVTTVAPGATGPSVPSSSAPTTGAVAVVGAVVPDVAAFEQSLTPAEEREATLALAAEGRHDVAVVGPVRTLCAVARVSGPVELAGRWERNGRQVESISASPVDAPGLGDCLDDADGDALEDGSYQFLVVDSDGNESAAGTIVVGAERVEQQLVNRGTAPICAVRIAPIAAGYFDAYGFDTAPIPPGATIALTVGAVEQDVRVTSCDLEPETLASFRFTPDPTIPLPLVDPP